MPVLLGERSQFQKYPRRSTKLIRIHLFCIPVENWGNALDWNYQNCQVWIICFEQLDAGKPTESKICDACHQTLTAFYEYYKSVLRNQAFFANKGKLVYEVFISTDSHADGQIPMKIEVELTEPITNDIETTECSTEELLLDEGKEDNSQEEVNPPRPTEKHVYKIPTESSSLYSIDEQLPAHLQSRSRKAESDAKIREFVKLKCDLCADRPESFRTFKELQTHFVEAHQTRGYIICCDKKIFRKDRILNHITNHVNPDAFKWVSL